MTDQFGKVDDWALGQAVRVGAAGRLALMVCLHAAKGQVSGRVTQSEVAAKLGIHRDSLANGMDELRAAGIIQTVRRGWWTAFSFCMVDADTVSTSVADTLSASVAETVTTSDADTVSTSVADKASSPNVRDKQIKQINQTKQSAGEVLPPVPPKPSQQPPDAVQPALFQEPTPPHKPTAAEKRAARKAAAVGEVGELFEAWRSAVEEPGLGLTPERERDLRKIIEECGGLENAKLCVMGQGLSEHHMGRKPGGDGKRWIEPKYCRRDVNRGQFIAAAKAKLNPPPPPDVMSLPMDQRPGRDLDGVPWKERAIPPFNPRQVWNGGPKVTEHGDDISDIPHADYTWRPDAVKSARKRMQALDAEAAARYTPEENAAIVAKWAAIGARKTKQEDPAPPSKLPDGVVNIASMVLSRIPPRPPGDA